MFIKAFVILASISAALAGPFITNPVAASNLVAGTPTTVEWIEDNKEPSLAKYGNCSISLYVGSVSSQTPLQLITRSVNVSLVSSVSYTPTPTIGENSDQYFIRMESLTLADPAQPQFSAMAFSSKFNLTGMTGKFTPEIVSQIKGQTTLSSTVSSRSISATSSALSVSKTPSSTSRPSAAASAAASHSTVFHGSWLGLLLALFGITML